ncbi:kelch domain-containing protein [Myxococcus stipitatus DSM 14675]|uniref:Kelch domain-containing protein n=1 Tax=Myxococcus stipitatus (strain DSM 14675 / JCM 12634 / Mx s8) TaxID=1278073 RepID=L7UQI2_MYXSD|nr:kelch motif-containing protein [Myxococcus stipitatus]AGC48824.1 kelch domain-containing protein [Myxococcus stipitatus DSM 14675]
MKAVLCFAGVLGLVMGLPLFACLDVDDATQGFCRENALAEGCTGWGEGRPMGTPRASHTATLLDDGRVMVVGGLTGFSTRTPKVEIYDPTTNRWRDLSALQTARSDHTATLLPGDQVLVVGGRGPAGEPLDSAELYNPVTNKWTDAGTLVSGARASHAALELPSTEEVLVAGGGNNPTGGLKSADIYSCRDGSWRRVAELNVPRNALSLTLVNGKAVAIGGFNEAGALGSMEAYDPNLSGAGWAMLPASLGVKRNGHVATLLGEGRVLVTGSVEGAVSSGVELLDMHGLSSVTAMESMKEARFGHTATELFSGQVLVTGGWKDSKEEAPRASAELYTPGGSWTLIPPMKTARAFHTATLLDSGLVLIVGGIAPKGVGIVPTTELYNPPYE